MKLLLSYMDMSGCSYCKQNNITSFLHMSLSVKQALQFKLFFVHSRQPKQASYVL